MTLQDLGVDPNAITTAAYTAIRDATQRAITGERVAHTLGALDMIAALLKGEIREVTARILRDPAFVAELEAVARAAVLAGVEQGAREQGVKIGQTIARGVSAAHKVNLLAEGDSR